MIVEVAVLKKVFPVLLAERDFWRQANAFETLPVDVNPR